MFVCLFVCLFEVWVMGQGVNVMVKGMMCVGCRLVYVGQVKNQSAKNPSSEEEFRECSVVRTRPVRQVRTIHGPLQPAIFARGWMTNVLSLVL